MRMIVSLVFAVLLTGSAAHAREHQVLIDNFTFTPQVLRIKAGDSVVWVNRDDIPHTVAEKEGAFSSDALDTGDTFRQTLAKPGEVSYFCTLHPHMTGSIIIAP